MGSRSSAPVPAAPSAGKSPKPRRSRLAAGRRRLSYERRIHLWLAVSALPPASLGALLVRLSGQSVLLCLVAALAVAALWSVAATYFFDGLVRPLQTLTNVVAALREDDFSFRARGARRGDTLGDLALEINALANTLQTQRSAARDALTLAERVMTSMQSPVLAFAPDTRLRLLNQASEVAFHLNPRSAVGRSAGDLGLATLLGAQDETLYLQPALVPSAPYAPTSWSVRRSTFRLHGVPHVLIVLFDVESALRQGERVAWQRLIRVLSHEINNSLTPIKSIAGSLRTRLGDLEQEISSRNDFHRGLTVIEDRAASLNRFLQAYQHLTHLPPPRLQRVPLHDLLDQLVALETRLQVSVFRGPSVDVLADPDQLGQLLINLIRNAVDAANDPSTAQQAEPEVILGWSVTVAEVLIHIHDNGPGLTNPANLFVPFYTTKPDGSGIGLVLAQQIAAAHKGSVLLRNRDGTQGCTAELRLPVFAVAAP